MIPRVVFFSSADISIPTLNFLKESPSTNLVGVITQPGRPKGRGQKISPNPVALWAQEKGVFFYEAEELGDAAFEVFKNLRPDLVFVMAFGRLLKNRFIDLPFYGMWNLHASLLPKLRGASPMQSAILNGDEYTGLTLMRMVEKMDAGPWVFQECIKIEADDTTATLTKKLAESGVSVLKITLPHLLDKTLVYIDQDPESVTYCKKISKEDGWLDFSKPAAVLERQIRAFQPWPSSYFFKNNERYIVRKAHVEFEMKFNVVGKFNIAENGTKLSIETGEGTLVIDVMQKAGGKPMPIADFLRGNNNF